MTEPTQQPQQQSAPHQTMADLAAYLVFQHQAEQEALAAKTAVGLALLWKLLRFEDLDENVTPWLHAATLQVQTSFRESEKLSHEMTQGVRWAWQPDAPAMELVENTFPTKDVQSALRVTGPIAVKRSLPAPEKEAMARGKVDSVGAGVKHAANGGRAEVLQLVARDKAAQKDRRGVVGWARVTDSDPCYFCALLASQGAVYLNDGSFARSNNKVRDIKDSNGKVIARRPFADNADPDKASVVKVHDHCCCSLRPVYSLADKYDERAQFFLNQWLHVTGRGEGQLGLSGHEAEKAFRRLYRKPEPYAYPPPVDLSQVKANRARLKTEQGASSPVVEFLDKQISKLA